MVCYNPLRSKVNGKASQDVEEREPSELPPRGSSHSSEKHGRRPAAWRYPPLVVPCDFPLKGFRSVERGSTGKPLITFNPLKAINSHLPLTIPCGRCTGCRLERSRQMALRCVHEAQLYDENCFVTLTFSDEHLPEDYSVHVRTWQLFMKRLRKSLGGKKIRSFACGEYGDENLRPHYHAILFNHDFSDKLFYKKTPQNQKLFTSQKLQTIWPYGHCTIGAVSFESAAYVARYVMKKYTNSLDPSKVEQYYTRINPVTGKACRVQPEFCTGSRRPGLGAPWLKRFKSDVYPSDYIIERNMKMKPPRFYDQKLTEEELNELKRRRKRAGVKNKWNGTPERLRVRATVRDARIKSLKRSLKDDIQ